MRKGLKNKICFNSTKQTEPLKKLTIGSELQNGCGVFNKEGANPEK